MGKRLGHRVGVRCAGLRRVHRPDRKPVLARELEIPLVVRGHTHEGTRAVLGQDEVREPDRDFLARRRIDREGPGRQALLLPALGLALEPRFAPHAIDEFLDRGARGRPLRESGHGRVLGRKRHERRAVKRVRPRREDRDRLGQSLDRKDDLRPLGASDPISLHRLDAVGPVREAVEALEQALGVVRDAEEPLRQVANRHRVPRALAAAVDDLLVGEHGPAPRAPVHRRGLAVGEAALPHPEKEPLVPAVVARVAGGELLGPVVEAAERAELLLHPGDVRQRVLARGHPALDGRVFGRQPEGVPAHGVQGLPARHALAPVQRVPQDVVAPVPDVQAAAGRVRVHVEHVKLVARGGGVHVGDALLGPAPLPLRLDFPGEYFSAIGRRSYRFRISVFRSAPGPGAGDPKPETTDPPAGPAASRRADGGPGSPGGRTSPRRSG